MEERGSTATADDSASGVVPGALVVLPGGERLGGFAAKVGLVVTRHHDRHGYDMVMVLLGLRVFELIPSGLAIVIPAPLPPGG